MLYLFKLDNAYKIGYSDNVEERFKTLQTTHIESSIISIKEGTKEEEYLRKEIATLKDIIENYKEKELGYKKLIEKHEEILCNICETLNLEEGYNNYKNEYGELNSIGFRDIKVFNLAKMGLQI